MGGHHFLTPDSKSRCLTIFLTNLTFFISCRNYMINSARRADSNALFIFLNGHQEPQVGGSSSFVVWRRLSSSFHLQPLLWLSIELASILIAFFIFSLRCCRHKIIWSFLVNVRPVLSLLLSLDLSSNCQFIYGNDFSSILWILFFVLWIWNYLVDCGYYFIQAERLQSVGTTLIQNTLS